MTCVRPLDRAAMAAIAVALLAAVSAAAVPIARPASLLGLSGLRFEPAGVRARSSLPFELAYGQAGMFVAFLHDADPAAFTQMVDAILDGRPFAEAASVAYGTDVQVLWLRFRRMQLDLDR